MTSCGNGLLKPRHKSFVPTKAELHEAKIKVLKMRIVARRLKYDAIKKMLGCAP